MDTSYRSPPGIVSLEEIIEKYSGVEQSISLLCIISSYSPKEIELVPIGKTKETYYNLENMHKFD